MDRIGADLQRMSNEKDGLHDIAQNGLPLLLTLLGARAETAAPMTSILQRIVEAKLKPVESLAAMGFVPALEALMPSDGVEELLKALQPSAQPTPLADRLDADLWLLIMSFASRWARYESFGSCCKAWRQITLADPSLWRCIVVVEDKRQAIHPNNAVEAPQAPDFNADAAEVSGFLGECGAVPYAKSDYLPLLPSQLRLLPDATWVRKLIICEPGVGEHESFHMTGEHYRRYWPLLDAVCSLSFAALTHLRLSFDGLDYQHSHPARGQSAPWRVRAKQQIHARLFPWLAALPPSLQYLAFDALESGEGVLSEFERWTLMRQGLVAQTEADHRRRILSWLPPKLVGLRYPISDPRRSANTFTAALREYIQLTSNTGLCVWEPGYAPNTHED